MRTSSAFRLLPILVLMAGPPGAEGQNSEGGRLEFSTLVDYTVFDQERLGLRNDFGLGVRVGYFLSSVLSVEALAARGLTSDPGALSVDLTELGGSVLANFRAGGNNRVYVGAGYSRMRFSGPVGFTDQAVHAFAGDRIPLSRFAAFRLEGRALYATSSRAPGPGSGAALSLRMSAGISLFVGERPPRDTDGDLVSDAVDQCPGTPPALAVDGNGCPRDTDYDGVFDGRDRCRATPFDVDVDTVGCALDGDDDGVPDYRDRCPSVGAGTPIDAEGCPLDDDADGVPDASDLCPASPPGSTVSPNGCPRDEDADGVPDDEDRCLGTPAGRDVDGLGCPILFEEREGERAPLILLGVTFELGEAVLTGPSYAVLDQVAASLLAYPEVRVEVGGHTDDQGTAEFNRTLSLQRASAVRDYLISRGIAADRLEAVGFGSTQPVATNDTEAGRARNRRVVLTPIEG